MIVGTLYPAGGVGCGVREGQRMEPIEWTEQTLEDAIRGRITVSRWGHPVPYRLNGEERREFEHAKQRHFLIARGQRANLENAYYEWCALGPQPYVVVRPRRDYATVKADLICCQPSEPHLDAAAEAESLLQRESAPGAWISVGTLTCSDKVPVERAEEVAAMLWAILTAPRPCATS